MEIKAAPIIPVLGSLRNDVIDRGVLSTEVYSNINIMTVDIIRESLSITLQNINITNKHPEVSHVRSNMRSEYNIVMLTNLTYKLTNDSLLTRSSFSPIGTHFKRTMVPGLIGATFYCKGPSIMKLVHVNIFLHNTGKILIKIHLSIFSLHTEDHMFLSVNNVLNFHGDILQFHDVLYNRLKTILTSKYY